MNALCGHAGGAATLPHCRRGALQPVSLASFCRTPLSPPAPGRRGLAGAPQQRRSPRSVQRGAAPDAKPFIELVNDAVTGKGELLSPRLDADVRRRAEEAITRRGGRVTVGDVAASAGLTLFQAEEALKALAADSLGALQVSDDGEIVYVFGANFRDVIRNKSLLLRLEPAAAKVAETAAYLGRVAFGTALVASVVTVYVAITVLASSKDERGGRRGGGGYGGGRAMFDLTDVLWYWDPFYFRRRAMLRAAAQASGGGLPGMGFLEAIFSFVFGDGDPNAGFERRRWEALGRYVQHRGGVVAAEELAPFLDVSAAQVAAGAARDLVVVDESYVLPALARFGGSPEVDAAGRILYRFPSLQQTARAARAAPPAPVALEAAWPLTEATSAQQVGVVALGVANLVGVLFLGAQLSAPGAAYALARNGLAWVVGAMPLLQTYAAAFFAVPAVRWLLNARRNAAIGARNEGRQAAARALQRPGGELRAKLDSAAQQAERRVIEERDVVFRSDRDSSQQPGAGDLEGERWERQLERRAGEREREAAQPAPRAAPVRRNEDAQQQRGSGKLW
jgi:hypothetical protein